MRTLLRAKLFSQGTKKISKPTPAKHTLTAEDTITGATVNSAEKNTQRLKDLTVRQGTGTMLDFPMGLIRSVPPINKVLTNDRYKKILGSYQDRLVKADRAGGEFLANKGKVFKSMFTAEDMIPKATVTTNTGKNIDAYVPTQVARLSAPVDKVKPFAVPMLAVLGLDSLYENSKSVKTDTEEGDFTVKNAADLREQLIDKIAATVVSLRGNVAHPSAAENAVEKIGMVMDKVATASEMLKQAHCKIASLEEDLGSLTETNKRLKLQIVAKERSQRATKLAKDMFQRGMIKQADINDQVDYIMGLNDENYNILLKTVENVPVKQARDVQKGLDKVSYMIEADNDEIHKPTLGDAIVEFARQI
ncbi:MAG: hypothetical protein PHI24_14975 [Desulfitobacteriaceae bacterium]|nr:hypothetical protein [Desulfitobacteriaceae bacterium]